MPSEQCDPDDAGNSPARRRMEGSPDYAVGALEALVRKIADGQAIVYVGAGVSQSAGLPSWRDLLKKLQKEASNRLKNQKEPAEKYFKELKKRSRNLEWGTGC